MPIEPINISGFARNPVGVEAILSRGSSAFGSILQGLTQVARDQANNQEAQQRDFLTEQRREIQLKERRGERVQDQANADRRFVEDTRQFDVKFDQGNRQFDVNIEQANLDRIRKDRGLDLQESGQKVSAEVSRGNLEENRQSNDIRQEDLTFRRNQATEEKAQRDEEHKVRLDTAKLELQQAQGKESQMAAKENYAKAQSEALVKMDELIKGGDKEKAKSFFNTTIEAYDFDPGTKARFAKQLGIEGGTTESGASSVAPLTELQDADLDSEIKKLEGAVNPNTRDGTQVPQAGEKTALRLSELRQEKERRKNGPSFMDSRRY